MQSVVVRLAPTVHGPRDHGFVPVLVAAARRHGVAAYAGDGSNRRPAVHRLDAARLYRLALEAAPAGSVLHGVGEEAVTIGHVFALDVPASSAATRARLGWSPEHAGLLADLADGDYFTPEAGVRTGNHWSPAR